MVGGCDKKEGGRLRLGADERGVAARNNASAALLTYTHPQTLLSDWPAPNFTNFHSGIASRKHQEFIAYATNRTVSFWDTSTQSHLTRIQHTANIHSIAFSPDDPFLAFGRDFGKINTENLCLVTVSIMFL